MTNVENTNLDQAPIIWVSSEENTNIWGVINSLFKTSDQEINKNLTPDTINDDSLKLIDKILPGLGEIIAGLAVIPSLFGLKWLWESIKKEGISKAKSPTVENIQSNLTYARNEYIWPYSVEYYDQMKTAQKLGSEVVWKPFVVKLWKTGLCWAWVRGILTTYMWFSWFPNSWANGEKRDTILEKNNVTDKTWKKVEFKKVKVKTPYDAKPWAIIPYEADAILWTSARKKYWHIEVKWSDGNYYFDTKAHTPWGSARVSLAKAKDMSAEEYKEKTWFQWYVYYPVIEWEINQVA